MSFFFLAVRLAFQLLSLFFFLVPDPTFRRLFVSLFVLALPSCQLYLLTSSCFRSFILSVCFVWLHLFLFVCVLFVCVCGGVFRSLVFLLYHLFCACRSLFNFDLSALPTVSLVFHLSVSLSHSRCRYLRRDLEPLLLAMRLEIRLRKPITPMLQSLSNDG